MKELRNCQKGKSEKKSLSSQNHSFIISLFHFKLLPLHPIWTI